MADAKPAEFTPKSTPPNALYCGNNLDILRRHVEDMSVDLTPTAPMREHDREMTRNLRVGA
jgi:hypothetical protein